MNMKANILSLLVSKQSYLNPALQRICTFIIENPEISKTITTKELAQQCEVAESSITRFVQEIGFHSFRDLKIALAEELVTQQTDAVNEQNEVLYDDISKDDSMEITIKKVIYQNIQRIQELEHLLELPQIQQAVEMISKAGTLNFVSTGSSNVASNEAILRFSRAGKKCIFWNDNSMQTISSSISSEDELFIGISDSGKTKSVLECLKLAKANKAMTLAITSNNKSSIAGIADVTLLTPKHSQSINSWESTTSKTSQILLIDILYVCYGMTNYEKTLDYLQRTQDALRSSRG